MDKLVTLIKEVEQDTTAIKTYMAQFEPLTTKVMRFFDPNPM
ncbi:hypothetical protein [Terrilactibacillus laevilacticus]|uniref:Transposase n=1 Tax=Terrilactibacillus laevilacticus TaxID=1380157 RepID=A0ABW5PUA8_9BACI